MNFSIKNVQEKYYFVIDNIIFQFTAAILQKSSKSGFSKYTIKRTLLIFQKSVTKSGTKSGMKSGTKSVTKSVTKSGTKSGTKIVVTLNYFSYMNIEYILMI